MKNRPVGDELFHTDGQTDSMTKLIVAFRNFASAPKNVTEYQQKIKKKLTHLNKQTNKIFNEWIKAKNNMRIKKVTTEV